MLKVAILQNFATIGIPNFDEELGKNWSIVALSDHLIDESRLKGLYQLNTRRLDLVIHNGKKFALLNLQAFKIFDCPLATNAVRQCLAYHLSSDGRLLFGIQPSGDVVLLTGGLQTTKRIRKSSYIKILSNPVKWYDVFPSRLLDYITGTSSESRSNQVSPENPLLLTTTASTGSSWWWPFQTTPSSFFGLSQHQSQVVLENSSNSNFPYITALPDGLAFLCAYSPENCYVFVSSYESALRSKSIANFKGSQVPGRWHRIIMHKEFILQWLEQNEGVPWFEAKLSYCNSNEPGETSSNTIGGAMLYAVQKGLGIEIVYGLVKWRQDKFTVHWEKVMYEVDWALTESSLNFGFGLSFVARLSSDCTKMAVVISTHLGMYTCFQDLPVVTESPIHLRRNICALCNHSDYDGTHFYKKDCWVSDVQWLVEDCYVAIMTLCGSLSVFYAGSGEPMILKVRQPGPQGDESKSARFFFPVFHPHQIRASEGQPAQDGGSEEQSGATPEGNRVPRYPTMKWIDSEKILTCSSGLKIELFSIQRVINLPKHELASSTDGKVKVKVKEMSWSNIAVPPLSSQEHGLSKDKPNILQDASKTTVQEVHDNWMNNGKEQVQDNYFPPRTERIKSLKSEDKLPHLPILQKDSELVIRPVSVYSNSSNGARQSSVTDCRLTSGNTVCFPPEEDFDEDGTSTSLTYKVDSASSFQRGESDEDDMPALIERGAKSKNLTEKTYELSQLQYSANPEGLQKVQNTSRKQSQLYMADDELSDGAGQARDSNSRRKPFSSRHRGTAGGWSTCQTVTSASSAHSLNRQHSSTQFETEQTSYSSPFSCVPTSAGEEYDQQRHHQDRHYKCKSPTSDSRIPIRSRSPVRTTCTSGHPNPNCNITTNSTNQVRLQMPPVPVISALFIPSTRASAILSSSSPRPEQLTEGTQVDEEFYRQPTHPPDFRYQLAPFGNRDRIFSDMEAVDENRNELRRLTTVETAPSTTAFSSASSGKTLEEDPELPDCDITATQYSPSVRVDLKTVKGENLSTKKPS